MPVVRHEQKLTPHPFQSLKNAPLASLLKKSPPPLKKTNTDPPASIKWTFPLVIKLGD